MTSTATRPKATRRWPKALTLGLSLVAALGAGLVASCVPRAPVVVVFGPPSQKLHSSDYEQVFQRWTRHETVLHETDTALEAWATYRSAEFREAFVARYADAYQLDPGETDRLRQAQHEAALAGYDFVVTTQSNNYKWNDIEKKTSPWRVQLIDGAGHVVTPDELREERFPDLFQQEFYPSKTPFSKTYSIRFNHSVEHDEAFLGERSGSLTLRLAGPFGHLDLVWHNQATRDRQ